MRRDDGELAYVLVVEDDEAIRSVVGEILAEEGIPFVVTTDGEQALAHLRQTALLPAVVLTDLMMPHLDGVELIGLIRRDPRLEAIRIVMMTAAPLWTVPRDVQLLRKPFAIEELVRAIRCVPETALLGA